MKDIFISYRRSDASTEAFLLFKDLTNDGYSVFYDHKSLGGGDFRDDINDAVNDCRDFVVILSATSFSDKIFQKDDVYRFEIETAFRLRKRIVGIMLESFPGFPEKLPESIEMIRTVNCIKLYIGYYEAMYSRLVSGKFLTSSALRIENAEPSAIALNRNVPQELESLARMTDVRRNESIQILLQIMNSFNDSKICMRFYRYIDLCDRNKGIEEIPPYDGVLPTDLVTYLSFFETLYIIVASGAIDLSVIDYAYRFRFFAGCNAPIMQESELLPLGYQYPNILSFYNMWCDYIVKNQKRQEKCDNIENVIPGYENDLHKKYAGYCFANKPGTPISIRFLNREMNWQYLTLKLISSESLNECMLFQDEIISNIEGNEQKNIFEALTEREMESALNKGICVGVYKDEILMAQMNLLVYPDEKENLALDLSNVPTGKDIAVIDYMGVHPSLRGYRIQKTLIFIAQCLAQNYRKSAICAVTSPLNTYSIKNFISEGFQIIATQPKYKSIRHYLWKDL